VTVSISLLQKFPIHDYSSTASDRPIFDRKTHRRIIIIVLWILIPDWTCAIKFFKRTMCSPKFMTERQVTKGTKSRVLNHTRRYRVIRYPTKWPRALETMIDSLLSMPCVSENESPSFFVESDKTGQNKKMGKKWSERFHKNCAQLSFSFILEEWYYSLATRD
jgi:hypothetical protein